MAYISPAGFTWLAGRVAGVPVVISAHTAAPGNDGTMNELPLASEDADLNYARFTLAAADISAHDGTADNNDDIELFTPTADYADDPPHRISHLGCRIEMDGDGTAQFFGWVALREPIDVEAGRPATVARGTLDFAFSLVTE